MLISLYSPGGSLRRELPDQLLRHQPARPAPAHSRHRPGRSLRRHRLRHARLAPARQAGQAGPHAVRRHLGDQGAEPPGAGRPGRRGPVAARIRSSPTPSARPAASSRPRSSRTSSSAATDDGVQVRIKDVGRAELGTQDYNSFGRLERQAGGRDGRLPAARRQPAQGGRDDLRDHEHGQGALPAGHGLQDRLRHHAGGRGLDPRDREDLRRGAHPRHARRVHLPAEPPGDDHPAAHRARVASSAPSSSSRCSASRSTRCRCSAWCSPSASWWTTRSSWSRRSCTTSSTA